MAPQGEAAVAVRLGMGGARTKGHPSPGLEHPGRGWTEPLGEGGRSGRQKRIRHPPSGLDSPGQAIKPVTWARGTKKARGRRTERGGERKRRGRRGGPKASVDAEASAVGRKEANKIASQQGCRMQGRGHADGHQMRNSPGGQGRHRKKAGDDGGMPPEKHIQCRGAERTGGTGGTRLGRRKAGQKGHEAPGGGHPRCRPKVNGQRQSGSWWPGGRRGGGSRAGGGCRKA